MLTSEGWTEVILINWYWKSIQGRGNSICKFYEVVVESKLYSRKKAWCIRRRMAWDNDGKMGNGQIIQGAGFYLKSKGIPLASLKG